jgi:hypothetical protein
MKEISGCSGPKQIANGQIRQSNYRWETVPKKIRHLFDLALNCFEELGGPDGYRSCPTMRGRLPLVGHRFLSGIPRPQTCKACHVRDGHAIHGAQGDQFVDVAWEEVASLDIGKRTWRAEVIRVPENFSDFPGPFGRFAEGQAASNANSANPIADAVGRSGWFDGAWCPNPGRTCRNFWRFKRTQRANLEINDSQDFCLSSQLQLNRRVGKLSGAQDDPAMPDWANPAADDAAIVLDRENAFRVSLREDLLGRKAAVNPNNASRQQVWKGIRIARTNL